MSDFNDDPEGTAVEPLLLDRITESQHADDTRGQRPQQPPIRGVNNPMGADGPMMMPYITRVGGGPGSSADQEHREKYENDIDCGNQDKVEQPLGG